MNSLRVFRSRLSVIWLLLVAATAAALEVGHGSLLHDIRYADAAVIVIAFVKVRFVVLDFMGLGAAPRLIRLIAELWVIGMCVLLCLMIAL